MINVQVIRALLLLTLGQCLTACTSEPGGSPDTILSIGFMILLVIAFFGLIFVSVAVANVIHVVRNRPLQRAREELVARIMLDLRARKKTHKYCVYLRSFNADAIQLPAAPAGPPSLTIYTFDGWLYESLSADAGAMLCIGNRGFQIGTPRIASTDATWRADVQLLLKGATLILLMPWDTDGVLEEFAMLAKSPKLRAKTIFVMPFEGPGADAARHWNEAQKQLGKLGYDIPRFQESGGLFSASGRHAFISDIASGEKLQYLIGKQL